MTEHNNYSTYEINCQALENNIGTLEAHYQTREKIIEQLIEAGKKIGYKHDWEERIENCGTYLETDKDGKILASNFCRERFCPVCAYKRSLMLYGITMSMMNIIKDSYTYIFLTLTQENVPYNDLEKELQKMSYAWKKFRQSKLMRNSKGFIRNVEVTINKEMETYHPHQHIVVAFDKNYYRSNDYIKHEEFKNQWKKSYQGRVENVHIKAINEENIEKAVAEVVKYSVKVNDLDTYSDIIPLEILIKSLKGKRLINYSGIFRDIKQIIDWEDSRGEKEHRFYRHYDGKYREF